MRITTKLEKHSPNVSVYVDGIFYDKLANMSEALDRISKLDPKRVCDDYRRIPVPHTYHHNCTSCNEGA